MAKFLSKDFDKLVEDTQKEMRKMEEDEEKQEREKLKDRDTDVKCRVCGEKIIESFSMRFNAKLGPMIIGPGSKQQFYRASNGYHCDNCGIHYDKLPKS